MKTRSTRQNRLLKIITIPLKALRKARDFYVRSLISYADKGNYGCGVMGMPSAHCVSSLPMSSSVNSSKLSYGESEDLKELIRAASTRTLPNRVDVGFFMGQQNTMMGSQPFKLPPRSYSVGMGRIDEDKPCDFGEANVSMKKESAYPRSRSCAVTKRSIAF